MRRQLFVVLALALALVALWPHDAPAQGWSPGANGGGAATTANSDGSPSSRPPPRSSASRDT